MPGHRHDSQEVMHICTVIWYPGPGNTCSTHWRKGTPYGEKRLSTWGKKAPLIVKTFFSREGEASAYSRPPPYSCPTPTSAHVSWPWNTCHTFCFDLSEMLPISRFLMEACRQW